MQSPDRIFTPCAGWREFALYILLIAIATLCTASATIGVAVYVEDKSAPFF